MSIIIFQLPDENIINKIKEIESRMFNLRINIKQLLDNSCPYVTIIGYENLEKKDEYRANEGWQSPLYYLFYKAKLPQLWIVDSLIYDIKNKEKIIVYVYLISVNVAKCVHMKLNHYVKHNYPVNTVKITCKHFSE
jgi:hypothetical protein